MTARPKNSERAQPGPVVDLTQLPALLTIEEVASLLRIAAKTAKDWARSGKLPGAAKVGREWRIRRDDLLRALAAGGQIGPTGDEDDGGPS